MLEWLNKWWQMEGQGFSTKDPVLMFDMACGSGECTIAFKEWWDMGKKLYGAGGKPGEQPSSTATSNIRRVPVRRPQITIPVIGPEAPKVYTIAADPYTSAAYQERTSLPCTAHSFEDISNGGLPPLPAELILLPSEGEKENSPVILETVVCSFALHLIENPSLLFSLLWELSTKAKWLLVLAPHKKPEIKDGWGWTKWDVASWQSCPMSTSKGELLYDRVHLRVYRSLNV